MDPLELLVSVAGILIVFIPLILTLTNRITRLETKMDCLLSWVIEIDPTDKVDVNDIKTKRDNLKKQIEPLLNKNGCNIPKD